MALAVVTFVCGSKVARAESLLNAADLGWLTSRLAPRDAARTRAALGPHADAALAGETLNTEEIRVLPLGPAECLVQRAADHHLNAAQLFSDPMFAAGGPLAVTVEASTIRRLDADFDLHSLFFSSGKDTGGKRIDMVLLVVGNGRLIVGYDHGGKVHHPDTAYQLYTGNYEFAPLFKMSFTVDAVARRFTQIRVTDRLVSPFASAPFVGPYNAEIQAFTVVGSKATVTAKSAFTLHPDITVPPIVRRSALSPSAADALAGFGCPVGHPWK
jgi:hypothetical protein